MWNTAKENKQQKLRKKSWCLEWKMRIEVIYIILLKWNIIHTEGTNTRRAELLCMLEKKRYKKIIKAQLYHEMWGASIKTTAFIFFIFE